MNPETVPDRAPRWTFRPGRGATVFALVGFVFLVSLGTWQMRRRAEAVSLRALGEQRLAAPAFDAAQPPVDPEWRRVRVTGTPDWDHLLVLPSRFMWMQPGQQWILPVRPAGAVDGAPWVLVNVGWVPDDEADLILVRERSAAAPRTFEGLARIPEPFPMARAEGVDPAGYPRRWRGIAPAQMGEALGVPVAPFVVVDGEGIPEAAEIPDRAPPIGGWRTTLPERPHGQYALTWYCLAATLLGVWLSLSVRREEV